jgi:hypothetical protein
MSLRSEHDSYKANMAKVRAKALADAEAAVREALGRFCRDRDAFVLSGPAGMAAAGVAAVRALAPEQEGASEALGEPKASEPTSPNAIRGSLAGAVAVGDAAVKQTTAALRTITSPNAREAARLVMEAWDDYVSVRDQRSGTTDHYEQRFRDRATAFGPQLARALLSPQGGERERALEEIVRLVARADIRAQVGQLKIKALRLLADREDTLRSLSTSSGE